MSVHLPVTESQSLAGGPRLQISYLHALPLLGKRSQDRYLLPEKKTEASTPTVHHCAEGGAVKRGTLRDVLLLEGILVIVSRQSACRRHDVVTMLKLYVTAQADKYVRECIVLPTWTGPVEEMTVEFGQRRELIVLAPRVCCHHDGNVLRPFHRAILGF